LTKEVEIHHNGRDKGKEEVRGSLIVLNYVGEFGGGRKGGIRG